jgi:hypothetical protein
MSDDFQSRLESAIQRGNRRKEANELANREKAMSEEEARRLHTSHRLALSDRITQQIELLANHFPGFRKETLFGEGGWGAACYRDDLAFTSGRRSNRYSRLEITVRPYNEYNVLDNSCQRYSVQQRSLQSQRIRTAAASRSSRV